MSGEELDKQTLKAEIEIWLTRLTSKLIEVLSICECKIEILTGKVEAVEQIVREGGSKTLPKPVHLLLYMCLSETKPLNVGLVPNLNPKEGKILYLLVWNCCFSFYVTNLVWNLY